MRQMSKRDSKWDILKGIAILLVVLGHAVMQRTPKAYEAMPFLFNYLANIIYSFHMPLFVFISGFLIYQKLDEIKRVLGRAGKLIYTFFICSVPFYFLGSYFVNNNSGSFTDFLLRIITQPQTSLWYLWVLPMCYLWLSLFKKLIVNENLAIIFSYLTAVSFQLNEFGFYQFRYFYFFFLVGYFVAKYKSKLSRSLSKIFLFSLIAYPLLFLIQYRNLYVFSSPIDFVFDYTQGAAARFILPLFAIVVFIMIAQVLSRYERMSKFFTFFGKRTLEIYIFHILFLKMGFGTGNIKFFSTFFISLFGALTVSYLLESLNIKKYLIPEKVSLIDNLAQLCYNSYERLKNALSLERIKQK